LKFVSDKATHGLANSLLVYPKPCLLPVFLRWFRTRSPRIIDCQ